MVTLRPRFSVRGYTLIELMIIVVIIAILAAVALPSYMTSVRKGRRADGLAALTNVQLAQEKLRASCPFYGQNLGGAANVCGANAAGSTVKAAATSPDGWYAVTLSAASSTGYTVTATGNDDQAKDSAAGTTCTLVLTVNAANPNGVKTPADCWD
jgi:type IV pilus assembly protein PilE